MNKKSIQTDMFSDDTELHQHIEEQGIRKSESKDIINYKEDKLRRYCGTCKYHRGCNVEGVKRNSVGQCLDYRHMFAPNLRSI